MENDPVATADWLTPDLKAALIVIYGITSQAEFIGRLPFASRAALQDLRIIDETLQLTPLGIQVVAYLYAIH